MRDSWIDVVRGVRWGTHFCQFYESPQDLFEVLVPYFQQGLEQNESCLWGTCEPLQVEEAKAALREAVPGLDERLRQGQIEILDFSKGCPVSSKFEVKGVWGEWTDKERFALERGYQGLRISVDMSGLKRSHGQDLAIYEATIHRHIPDHRVIVLCSYQVRNFGVCEVIDVVNNHHFALAKRAGCWEAVESEDRWRAETATRESESLFQAVFNRTQDAIVIADDEGRYVDANPAACSVFGRPVDQLIGQCIPEVLGPDIDFQAIWPTFLKEGTFRGQHQLIGLDGTVRDVESFGVANIRPKRHLAVVRDEGVGFDLIDLERRMANSEAFGLFGIRERLELLGGRLELKSSLGGGTSIAILAPLGSPQAPTTHLAAAGGARARPLTGVAGAQPFAVRSRPIRVLLADDHSVVRKGLADLLRDRPEIEVVGTAQDGREAVDLALEARPDVVLMDVTMPRMNGIEATRFIKAQQPHVKVIALSMHEEKDLAAAMYDAGAVAYLMKGLSIESLIAAILGHAGG